jgi:ketosteroid isomerase-like protein
MSQENVEIMRRAFDAWTQGELAEAIAFVDENAIIQPIIGPKWHGPQGLLEMFADWVEGFDQFSMTAEEFIDAGDCVVVRVRQEGRGSSTGVPVQVIFWFVFSVKHARITCLEMFEDREPAFEAAGLSKQDAHADS